MRSIQFVLCLELFGACSAPAPTLELKSARASVLGANAHSVALEIEIDVRNPGPRAVRLMGLAVDGHLDPGLATDQPLGRGLIDYPAELSPGASTHHKIPLDLPWLDPAVVLELEAKAKADLPFKLDCQAAVSNDPAGPLIGVPFQASGVLPLALVHAAGREAFARLVAP